jgi:arsenate reductase
MSKKKILFVCIHNSARSQIAEALLNSACGDVFEAESAGLEPGKLNPLAIEVLREIGIDISKKDTRSVDAMLKSGVVFSHVVTVCDEASAERCPVFPGSAKRLHWGFRDPSRFEGSWDERIAQTRIVRAEIEAKVKEFCAASCCSVG